MKKHDKEPNTTEETVATEPVAEAPAVDPNLEKITELTNDLQRTRADFENYRKNVEKDRENAKKLASFATIHKILSLIDDFGRAIETYPELKPLEKNFEKTLKDLGLERINTEKGTEFNPEFHEAVMSSGEGDKEVICETLRSGYLYEGEVIRPAMVKIELQ